jgi:glutamate-1-semialdehyde 2,1-aminomutase
VTPDLAVFAKAMANGFPISAVAGRRDVMSAATDGPVRIRGTYNGNPVSVAAANATIGELARHRNELYPALEERSAALADGLRRAAEATGAPLRVSRAGSVLGLSWGLERDPISYLDVAQSDTEALKRLEEELLVRGVYTIDGERLFVSAVHTAEEIAATVEIFGEALAAI